MPYPEALVAPMRLELTRLGVKELETAGAVDSAFEAAANGTMFLVVNSVCGCAAANARPAVAMALQTSLVVPPHSVTVFAGQDLEATERARTFLTGIPPSSPSLVIFHKGEPVFLLERRHIEGRSASAIAEDLVTAFDKYCGGNGAVPDLPRADSSTDSDVPDTFRSIL